MLSTAKRTPIELPCRKSCRLKELLRSIGYIQHMWKYPLKILTQAAVPVPTKPLVSIRTSDAFPEQSTSQPGGRWGYRCHSSWQMHVPMAGTSSSSFLLLRSHPKGLKVMEELGGHPWVLVVLLLLLVPTCPMGWVPFCTAAGIPYSYSSTSQADARGLKQKGGSRDNHQRDGLQGFLQPF